MTRVSAEPIRYPDTGSTAVMTRRGWWLIVLNFLLPGSAQVLAGNRKLGRIGHVATIIMWLFVVIAAVMFFTARGTLLTLLTKPWLLLGLQAVLIAYAVLWIVLAVDTLRLVRLVRVKPRSRLLAPIAVVTLVALSAGTAGAGAYYAGVTGNTIGTIFDSNVASVDPVDGYYNILLLGADTTESRSGLGARPDSISVVSLNADTGQATMFGLPRDMLNVPFSAESPMRQRYPDTYARCDVSACKLNSIYTEAELRHADFYPNAAKENSSPGIEATKDAAEGLTGLSIPYYVMIDMDSFTDLIDALGGVTVTVEHKIPVGGHEDLSGVKEWIQPGEQHMNGYYAMWFARARYGSSDFDRMSRQRQLQMAILKQFTPQTILTKFEGIAQAGAKVVKTDVPQSMIGYFADLGIKTKDLPIQNLELTPANGVDQDYPDIASVHAKIAALLHPAS